MPQPLCLITRLRADAAPFQPGHSSFRRGQGSPRRKGARLPTVAQMLVDPATVWAEVGVPNWHETGERMVEIAYQTAVRYHAGLPPVPIRWVLVRDTLDESTHQALRCTDLKVPPAQILAWFVMRWQPEVTFAEVRARLGVETQRQWSDLAISRTTPALMGLIPVVKLIAHRLSAEAGIPVHQASWYQKAQPTFFDALAEYYLSELTGG